jgi:hypothetical protein
MAAAVVLACLTVLVIVAGRRWGAPRSYVSLRATAWLAVIVMVLILLRLALD